MNSRCVSRLIWWLAAICCLSGPAAALPAQGANEPELIRERIEQLREGNELVVGGEAIASVIVLPALYEQNEYRRIWTNDDSIEQLLHALRNIEQDCLDARDYHLQALEKLRTPDDGRVTDPVRQAELDLLLTDSLVRLGYHLLFGKVDPVALDADWNMKHQINRLDDVLAYQSAITNGTLGSLIDGMRPAHPFYGNLKKTLARYRELADSGGWPEVPAGKTLKEGMSDPRLEVLGERLHITGDMPDPVVESMEYDQYLIEAVKRFQSRHGLDVDGITGPGTLRALNVPVQDRMDQLCVNLERARWVLHKVEEEALIVDIAGFNVMYQRNGEPVWNSRVQVGKPYRKTPVFKSKIRYLVMNPTWTVPPTILVEDILPAVKMNPGYLKEKNIRVLTHEGGVIDESDIDWSRYSGLDFPYLLRQDPGPSNAVGRIKFMFPNDHLVYLHDTPNKSLFDRSERAFSSGCIRVERPYSLAELLLDNSEKWSREAIVREIETAETRTVFLPQPVTVMLLYWTADIDDEGRVVFKKDIYDRDPPILAGLRSEFSFRRDAIFRQE